MEGSRTCRGSATVAEADAPLDVFTSADVRYPAALSDIMEQGPLPRCECTREEHLQIAARILHIKFYLGACKVRQ